MSISLLYLFLSVHIDHSGLFELSDYSRDALCKLLDGPGPSPLGRRTLSGSLTVLTDGYLQASGLQTGFPECAVQLREGLLEGIPYSSIFDNNTAGYTIILNFEADSDGSELLRGP